MTPPAAASGETNETHVPKASLGGRPSVKTDTLSARPVSRRACASRSRRGSPGPPPGPQPLTTSKESGSKRSEAHTSELQSRQYLVCRLLLEKKHTPSNEMKPSLI